MNNYVENEAPLEDEIIEDGAGGVDTIESNEEVEQDTVEDTAGQEEIPHLDIPEDWEVPVKEFLNTGFGDNFEAKKAFHEKYSSFSKDFSSRYKDFDIEKKALEQDRTSFEDNRNMAQGFKALEESCRGVDDNLFNREVTKVGGTNQYFQGLHTVNSMLEKDPLSTINNICSSYGITPQMLADGVNNPDYMNRQNQISNNQLMEQKIEQAKQDWEQQRENEKIEGLITSFNSSANDDGTLKYPNFEQVRNNMASLLEQQGVYNPTLNDLDSAYNNACYADQNIRSQLIQSQVESQVKTQMQQREVQKAENVVGVKTNAKSISKQKSSVNQVIDSLINNLPDDDE